MVISHSTLLTRITIVIWNGVEDQERNKKKQPINSRSNYWTFETSENFITGLPLPPSLPPPPTQTIQFYSI